MDYIYPDVLDQLTSKMIPKLEPYSGYWDSSERIVLDHLRASLRKRSGVMLDAGCGDGRLIPVFADLFDTIVAIDADSSRLANAEGLVTHEGLSDKVRFENVAIESLDMAGVFDFALCSHIIQHVNTETVHRIMESLSQAMRPGGSLALFTNYSTRSNDHFLKYFIKDENLCEEEVSKDEFNHLIDNNVGILPVHCFTKKTLIDLLELHGFSAVDVLLFHCMGDFGELDQIIHRDYLVNAVPELQSRFGRDICIRVVKK